MATAKPDKYENYRYEIVNPDEMREALWLIEQGDFKDIGDYIDCLTRAEKRRMKREDAELERKRKLRKLATERRKNAA